MQQKCIKLCKSYKFCVINLVLCPLWNFILMNMMSVHEQSLYWDFAVVREKGSLFQGMRRWPDYEADHPFLSSSKIKKVWSFTFMSSWCGAASIVALLPTSLTWFLLVIPWVLVPWVFFQLVMFCSFYQYGLCLGLIPKHTKENSLKWYLIIHDITCFRVGKIFHLERQILCFMKWITGNSWLYLLQMYHLQRLFSMNICEGLEVKQLQLTSKGFYVSWNSWEKGSGQSETSQMQSRLITAELTI
jgi:hypothetical protein